jgi:predicted DCC family thiol-disulfide oxidoreductase YuxK
MSPTPPACAVFYDGSCPLCSAEIGLYRRQDTATALTLIDVSQDATALPDGLTQAAAMARFHVMTSEGRILSGAAAFAEVWRALPGWRWLARLSDLPAMLWLMERAYRGFLPLRPLISYLFGRWLRRG